MISSPFDYAPDIGDNNPLELVEELCESKGWKFTRVDNELLTLTVEGTKMKYEICLEWQEEFSAVLFACSMPIEIKDEVYDAAAVTIQEINENLWMGHFDLSNKGVYPTYRQTLLFRMIRDQTTTTYCDPVWLLIAALYMRAYVEIEGNARSARSASSSVSSHVSSRRG